MNIISPNMMKTFELCPKKFEYCYIKNISIPQQASFFEKGKKIHALANYFLNGYDISKMEQVLSDKEKVAWSNLKNNKYLKLEKVQTEYALSCKVGDFWVGGRLDALMKNENSYTILDYKTGRIPDNPELDYQTIIYLLCTDKFVKEYQNLQFVYIDLKNSIEKNIIFDEEKEVVYKDKITKMCKNIDFAVKSNVYLKCKKCKNCEYEKICKEKV